ncbi:TRAP transporter substrate-binding protein [Brevibacillus ruminantium]|uniref:TRAP transporter substrate-binding protein n=1 Tax=Brevibacillus ruminantium TaxID=2950604 RepID=A0ABY4WBB4_9BACL|nr:TRAP transporter substrate-binding protein [Brevibacillus ruminantium]USG64338.1 TRAP transporter substrate-binding protein [Brevibacillus ruminantium]
MKKTLSFTLASILSLSLVLAGCGNNGGSAGGSTQSAGDGSGGQSYKFRLTHITQTSHIWHKTAEKFSEELEVRSNGRMKVDLFPAGQFGAEKDMVQQLETGSLDFGIITNGYLSTRSEAFNAWFMPFLFENIEEATKARKTESAAKILDELSSQGLQANGVVFAGNRHILTKDTPVTSPEDLKGKKIRILGSPAVQDFWTAVGAGPTPMPLPEVYTSLQSGVIDGIEIDLDALNTEKYYEIAKNLTLANLTSFPGVFVTSKAAFDKLSPEDQKIVNESIEAALEWGNQESIAREKSTLEELKTKGVTITELSNKDTFNTVRDQVYAKYSNNPLIKAFIDENKK